MAKAIEAHYGTDTYGREVEIAKRTDGQWFSRHTIQDQYGARLSKWTPSEEPSYITTDKNVYSGETFEYDTPIAMWGFNRLEAYEGKLTFRLPNN